MSEREEEPQHDGATEATHDRRPEGRKTEQAPSEGEGKKADGDAGPKSDEPKKKGSGRPPAKVPIIAAIVLLVLALGGVLYYLHARNYVSTDDAFVAGHIHEISSRVPGTILSVAVSDNEVVHRSQTLVQLDPREFDLAVEKARAQLAQARAKESAASAEVAQRVAASAEASAQLEKATTDYQRASGLYQQDVKAVSKAEVDTNSAQLKTAKGAFQAAQANEQAARAQEGVAQADIQNAQAALDDAELQKSFTVIEAPVNGSVAKKNAESGRRLQPGQALMAVVEPDVWVVANLKETELAKVKIGQSVKIDIDAIPDHEFEGHVDSFQAGTGAVFALLPPDNATGNFTKIVQRLPVKIVFDPASVHGYENRIVPGLSAAPTIDLTSR